MKSFKILILASLLISIIAFPNCGGKDPDGKDKVDAAKEQAERLVQSWTLVANSAQNDDSGVIVGWNGLTLVLEGDKNGGSFTTNVGSLSGDAVTTEVWPASDGWSFKVDSNDDTVIGSVIRDSDGLEMTVNVTATSLIVNFTIGNEGSRFFSVDGNWTFTFERS